MRKFQRLVLGLSLLGFVAVLSVMAGKTAYFAFTPAHSDSKDSYYIEIRKGEGAAEISKQLASAGVVSDAETFRWLGKVTRAWKRVKANEYKVSPGMAPYEVFSVITSGIGAVHPLTITEGRNIFEVAQEFESKKLISKEKFLALCKDPKFIATLGLGPHLPTTLEGYLFPETYFFNRSMTPEDMVRQVVKHFFAFWGAAEDSRAQALGMTPYQILILASIIEKETGAPEERPLISSVFYNRLHKGMKLQSDPTTIYGIWDHYDGNIHRSDLLSQTPYNTYAISGLPVGPIANPGKEAIHAALYPSQSEYLYFVSHNDGTHQFSRTFNEHNLAVQKFQLDPKAREGKSWRDLKKRTENRP